VITNNSEARHGTAYRLKFIWAGSSCIELERAFPGGYGTGYFE